MVGELLFHFSQLLRARYAPAGVDQVVFTAVVNHDAMVVVIHPQVKAIAFTFVNNLHADHFASEFFPGFHVFDTYAQVSQFGYFCHGNLLLKFSRFLMFYG